MQLTAPPKKKFKTDAVKKTKRADDGTEDRIVARVTDNLSAKLERLREDIRSDVKRVMAEYVLEASSIDLRSTGSMEEEEEDDEDYSQDLKEFSEDGEETGEEEEDGDEEEDEEEEDE